MRPPTAPTTLKYKPALRPPQGATISPYMSRTYECSGVDLPTNCEPISKLLSEGAISSLSTPTVQAYHAMALPLDIMRLH